MVLMPTGLHSRRYDRFRALLVDQRRKSGLTQDALARKLDKPQSYVSKYENGERRLDVIEFLDVAAAVGFDASDLIRELRR